MHILDKLYIIFTRVINRPHRRPQNMESNGPAVRAPCAGHCEPTAASWQRQLGHEETNAGG